MDPINILIGWLKEIEEGKDALIPYSLHGLVNMFYNHYGTSESINKLEGLKRYAKELKKEKINE